MSAFDAGAHGFDRNRALPPIAAESVHTELMRRVRSSGRARVLDLGAGSGRFAGAFLRAGHDYVGLDVSSGMLQAFRKQHRDDAVLVQADGGCLPFGDAVFDAVLLMHVFGGMRGWRGVVGEVRRVLTPSGIAAVGRVARPADGIDVRLNHYLSSWLGETSASTPRYNAREDALAWLESGSHTSTRSIAARWEVEHTPRGFLKRKATGAQFQSLTEPLRSGAIQALSAWAQDTFGSLDAVFRETHELELRLYTFT